MPILDDKTDPANPVTLGTWNWADGEHTFTYSLDKQGVAGTCTDYTNTAVIDETDQSDSQTVTVCVGKDLTVTKTAVPYCTRTFAWDIYKDVDETLVEIAAGGDYTFNYTVRVTHDQGTDSEWYIEGVITIENPNEWEAITLSSLIDLAYGGICSWEPGPYVVPAKVGGVNGKLEVDYKCTFTKGDSATNFATAFWNKDTYATPNGSAMGTKDFAFVTPTTLVDESITVSDTYAGTLGTVLYTDASPTEFTYTRKEWGEAGTCTDYDNTASFVTVDSGATDSASESVKLCVGSARVVFMGRCSFR